MTTTETHFNIEGPHGKGNQMSDKISREDALRVTKDCPDSHWGPWIADRIRALPAMQPDAAAIREAAREAIAALIKKEQGQLLSDYNVHPEIWKNDPEMAQAVWDLTDAILALMDNTGKEVMPDEARTTRAAHDIGPGDQAVAGAAPRRASGPIDSDAGFATSGAEARWIADIDAGVYDDARPEPGAGAAPVTVLEAAQVLEENVTSPQYQDALQEIMLHGLSPYKAHEIIGGFLHALAQKDGE